MPKKNLVVHTFTLPNQQPITLEHGLCAQQADSAVLLRTGDAVLLATVVTQPSQETLNFLPLTVDYQESFAGAGRIPGGFLKREGRPSEQEVLIARKVDRMLRPRFAPHFADAVQVQLQLLSVDPNVEADTLAALAASAALGLTDIPFEGPVSSVRVARIAKEHIINPTPVQRGEADLDMVVGGTADGHLLMLEGHIAELPEEVIAVAVQEAQKAIQAQCQAQQAFFIKADKAIAPPPAEVAPTHPLAQEVAKHFYQQCYKVASQALGTKKERSQAFKKIQRNYLENPSGEGDLTTDMVAQCFQEAKCQALRDMILNEGIRLDGRKASEIRQIDTAVSYLPGPHGSALFTRGETQALGTVTLGGKLDEQLIDSPTASGTKRVMLHYTFPGFSTGEVKPQRSPGRREIGHGTLALNAIKPVLPSDLSYTLRIDVKILSSNGSSSMATVCAASQGLMDAGIPITGAVAGVAMGVIADPAKSRYVILSDILGEEDQVGGADFKVAGTAKGITACQMDTKLPEGLPLDILLQTLKQACKGYQHILEEMAKTIDTPRASYKSHAPRVHRFQVPKEAIGGVIGSGGKVIQQLQSESGTRISITEQQNHGLVEVFAPHQQALEQATKAVECIAKGPTVGETYTGHVLASMDYGVFIEFAPGMKGLLHKSEMKDHESSNPHDLFEKGQGVTIKLIAIHPKTGKYSLSQKALIEA